MEVIFISKGLEDFSVRGRVDYRARAKVAKLTIEKVIEILEGAHVDEYCLCGDCREYEERGDSACDFCPIPDWLHSINESLDEAIELLEDLRRRL